jgi:hypothetical protein
MLGRLERKRFAGNAGNGDGCAPVILVARAFDDSAKQKTEEVVKVAYFNGDS